MTRLVLSRLAGYALGISDRAEIRKQNLVVQGSRMPYVTAYRIRRGVPPPVGSGGQISSADLLGTVVLRTTSQPRFLMSPTIFITKKIQVINWFSVPVSLRLLCAR